MHTYDEVKKIYEDLKEIVEIVKKHPVHSKLAIEMEPHIKEYEKALKIIGVGKKK